MSKNIVIIGAGAIGLSCALPCARKGHRVTVIERHGAERDGCLFGNAAMIVPNHFVPLAMMGMSLSPITGQMVSEIVGGEKPSFDLSLFSPDRYA